MDSALSEIAARPAITLTPQQQSIPCYAPGHTEALVVRSDRGWTPVGGRRPGRLYRAPGLLASKRT